MKAEGIDGIEKFTSPGKGRGLRVSKHYKIGDLLFACPAYSYVLSVSERGVYCDFCFTRKEGLAKCGKCKNAFYCNVDCQKGGWPMHKLECASMCVFGKSWCPSETTRLVARTLVKQKAQKARSESEKLLLIGEMEAHLDKLDNQKQEASESDIAGLHRFYSKHLEIPDHPSLLTLLSQVNCNGFTVEDEELTHLGSAVFPDVALVNHSCSPNVIVTYRGLIAEVRAVQALSPGDEVLTSYIDLLYPTVDRIHRLRDTYYFTCDCPECRTKAKDKLKMKVRKMANPPSDADVREMIHYGQNVVENFCSAKREKTPGELLRMCELSLERMGSVLDDANVYVLHMMYQAMGVCMCTGDWEGAVSYGEKIIKPYSILYPPYSLNVAAMYLKLGRLHIGLERTSLGVKAIKKAIAIMEVAHGKDHPYVETLRKEISVSK